MSQSYPVKEDSIFALIIIDIGINSINLKQNITITCFEAKQRCRIMNYSDAASD